MHTARPASPSVPLPSVKTDLARLPLERDIVVWLDHSCYFVQIGGQRILADPVFSNYATPLPGMEWAFDGTSPYNIDSLPEIDAVLITQDH